MECSEFWDGEQRHIACSEYFVILRVSERGKISMGAFPVLGGVEKIDKQGIAVTESL